MYGIKLKTRKAEGEYDKGCSKMLGAPTIPEKWVDEFPDTVMFLMQIRLEDIKDLDEENLLPHQGYLYFFLDTVDGIYSLKPIVRYYADEPTHCIDEFNGIVEGFENLIDDYIIEFEKCDETDSGNKLLGAPGDWQYQEEADQLLFQLDPLDNQDLGLFDTFDGYIYFFFGKDKRDFSKVRIVEDIS